ncbi:hypothetical protein HK102_003943 [Quaeritorhiza haematococci]|nr:hypothetical protein HK102_003943 [Quaeritorhiza haematococci]
MTLQIDPTCLVHVTEEEEILTKEAEGAKERDAADGGWAEDIDAVGKLGEILMKKAEEDDIAD